MELDHLSVILIDNSGSRQFLLHLYQFSFLLNKPALTGFRKKWSIKPNQMATLQGQTETKIYHKGCFCEVLWSSDHLLIHKMQDLFSFPFISS